MTKKAELALPETKDVDDRDSTIKQKVLFFMVPQQNWKTTKWLECTKLNENGETLEERNRIY